MPRRVQVEWTGLAGSPYLTTLYFTTGTAGTEQALVNAVDAALEKLDPVLPSQLAWTVLGEVTEYSAPDQPTGVVTVTAATGNGNSTSSLVPVATQGLLRLRTGAYRGAREVQGRIFIPGVNLGAVDSVTARPSSAYRAAITTLGTDLVALGLMVASRAANQFYAVQGASAWTEFAVLRSRRD